MAAKQEAPSAAEIKWNEKAERFETEDKKAFLQYHLAQLGEGKTVMDMAHTFVPVSKRGMGLAAKLCDAAFAHAQSRSLPVIPTCSYISVCAAALSPFSSPSDSTFLLRVFLFSVLFFHDRLVLIGGFVAGKIILKCLINLSFACFFCHFLQDTYLPKNPAWNSLIYKDEPKSSM
jgi:uncharacterized protein